MLCVTPFLLKYSVYSFVLFITQLDDFS